MHPEKTKVVYYKLEYFRRTYPNITFDFLGYMFRPRKTRNRRGKYFLVFNPAISRKVMKAIQETIQSWELARTSPYPIERIAARINATVCGWIDYYGAFIKSVLRRPLEGVECHLARWLIRNYNRFLG